MQTPNRKPFVFGRDADRLNRWLDSVSRSDRDATYAPSRYDTETARPRSVGRWYADGMRHVA